MPNVEEEIKQKISEHMRKYGGSYLDWYVGVTSDPETGLFKKHKVNKSKNSWLFIQADDSIAKSIGHYFINFLGTDGKTNGVEHPNYIYIYKKTWHTKP